MKKKQILPIFLAGILAVGSTTIGVSGAEFSDGSAVEKTVNDIFESAPEPETKDVIKDGVRYTYQKDSDTYTVTGFTPEIVQELVIEAGIGGKAVTAIADGAFCESWITKAVIPDSITKIGDGVFEECTLLRSVTWGRGLKTIPANTFSRCCIEEFRVPDTVTSIGENAFSSYALRRIYIPAAVKEIHKNAFYDGKMLTLFVDKGSYAEAFAKKYNYAYDVGAMEQAFVTLDGVTYQYNSAKRTYKVIGADKELAGEVVIPGKVNGSSVTEIGIKAFYSHDKITSAALPDTITTIGDEAFWGRHMESVNIPASVTGIGEYAFARNDFTRIILPDSVKALGEGAFGACERMKEIRFPKAMKKVPESVCGGDTELNKVTLSDNVTEIGKGAFAGCGFTSFPWPSRLEVIGEKAFEGNVKLNFTRVPSSVKTIDTEAFGGCNSLKAVTIPGTVKNISSYLFWQCAGLEKVIFDKGVEKIDHRILEYCDNLKEVHIPETVYFIEDMELKPGCSVYGLTGTEAERFAHSYGYPFVSQGKAAIGVPSLKVTAYSCNNLKPEIKSRCLNADFYEYVLSKDKNFPKTGKYVYYQEKSQYLSTDFYCLDKGTYYVFARAGRYDIDNTGKYSAWTKPVKVTIAAQAPGIPKIKSITVKGTTVTVTLNRLSGADGYTAVLAAGADKVGVQKLYQPYKIQYSSSSKAAAKLVFKNVKPGSYRLLTRGYKQGTGGKFYGKWGRYSKKITVK